MAYIFARFDYVNFENEFDSLKTAEKSRRPLGSNSFVEKLKMLLGRSLKPKKGGRKKRE